MTLENFTRLHGQPTYQQYDNRSDQWLEWRKQAAILPLAEVRRHAAVSMDNRHECEECFCCAALALLRQLRSVDYA